MALVFRNLDVSPTDPVEEWGSEGIVTAIERGGLDDWARITRAVQRDPWGEAAKDLEEALDLAQSPGVVATLRTVLDRARETEAEAVARKIRRWVQASGMTRAELAATLGTSRSRLSSYERGRVTPSAIVTEKLRQIVEDRRAQLIP